MRHRSKKTEAKYVERRKIVERMLKEHPRCTACLIFGTLDGKRVVRQNQTVDINEIISRGRGGSILDESNLIAVCRFPCHARLTANPKDAEWCGLLLPSWASDEHKLEAAARRSSLASGNKEIGDPSWW